MALTTTQAPVRRSRPDAGHPSRARTHPDAGRPAPHRQQRPRPALPPQTSLKIANTFTVAKDHPRCNVKNITQREDPSPKRRPCPGASGGPSLRRSCTATQRAAGDNEVPEVSGTVLEYRLPHEIMTFLERGASGAREGRSELAQVP
jgi:hypothetical protein